MAHHLMRLDPAPAAATVRANGFEPVVQRLAVARIGEVLLRPTA